MRFTICEILSIKFIIVVIVSVGGRRISPFTNDSQIYMSVRDNFCLAKNEENQLRSNSYIYISVYARKHR